MKLLRCNKCKKYKSLRKFSKSNSVKRGHQYRCRECQRGHSQEPEIKLKRKGRMKKYSKEYNQRPEVNKHQKKYQKRHRQKPEVKGYRREYQKEWSKRQRKTNPMFRLNENIKVAIGISLKGNKNGRHWESLVGFTLIELSIHQEKLFLPGMTWENYGEWHTDHIKPISSFKFNSPDDPQFKECWSLKNLRPLWAKDNLVKGSKVLNYKK